VTTRASVRWRKAVPWVKAAQGGGNTMTLVVARRNSVGGEGGIMWAP
jgi:hypothetical protein